MPVNGQLPWCSVAWWAVRRYEYSYWNASVKQKLKIELKDNAKKWIKIFHIITGWCFGNLGRRCLLLGCKTANMYRAYRQNRPTVWHSPILLSLGSPHLLSSYWLYGRHHAPDLFTGRGRRLVTGSPFQYTVGKSPAGGTHKVDFGGVGVDKGQVGIKSKSLHFFPRPLAVLNFRESDHRHRIDKYLDTLRANQTARKAKPPTIDKRRQRKMADCRAVD